MKKRLSISVAASGGKKTDNAKHGRSDKIAIRKEVLFAITPARVFEGFAGSGTMYRSVWCGASEYVGCDLRFFRDKRTAFVADNRRVLRTIDLDRFNVFDFDAYGSPWEQCMILMARRKVARGERIGLVLTEGSRMKMTFGGLPKILADLAGVSANQTGANRSVGEIVDRAIAELCRRWGVKIVKQWRAESKSVGSARPLYIGMILEGINGAESPGEGCDILQEGTAGDRA